MMASITVIAVPVGLALLLLLVLWLLLLMLLVLVLLLLLLLGQGFARMFHGRVMVEFEGAANSVTALLAYVILDVLA